MEDKITLEIPTYQVGQNIVCLEHEVSNVVNALMQENTKLLNLLEKATNELVQLRELKPKLEEEYKNKLYQHKQKLFRYYQNKKDRLIEDYKERNKKFNKAIDENKLYRKYYGKLISPQELLFKLFKEGTCEKYDKLEAFSNIKIEGGGRGLEYAILLWKKIFKDLGIYRKIGNNNIAYMDYHHAEKVIDNLKIESEEEHFIKTFMKGNKDEN